MPITAMTIWCSRASNLARCVRCLEKRFKPLKSWSALLGPWLGLIGLAAIIVPFVIY